MHAASMLPEINALRKINALRTPWRALTEPLPDCKQVR